MAEKWTHDEHRTPWTISPTLTTTRAILDADGNHVVLCYPCHGGDTAIAHFVACVNAADLICAAPQQAVRGKLVKEESA